MLISTQPCVTSCARALIHLTPSPQNYAVPACTRVMKMCFTPIILRCFCATILHPHHPQPREPLTPQIHRAARSLSPPHPPIVQKYRHCFLSFSRSPQPAAFADHKRLVASRTGSDDKAAPASKDHGARTGGAPHQELLAEPHRSHGRCRHAISYRIIVMKAFQLLALRY